MKENYTDITVVLDRSGSMESIKDDTIGGYNKFLKGQKEVKGECTISLYQFDDKYEPVYEGQNIQHVAELNNETFVPRGWTALLDAIGRSINDTGARLAKLKEEDRPDKVIFVIQTDGAENQSKEFTREKIFEMIKHQSNNYNWKFLFLGANQDAIATATSYGIISNNSITYAANNIGTHYALSGVSCNITNYRSNITMDCGFTDEDRKRQDEALNQ
jgi:hypothetical protein